MFTFIHVVGNFEYIHKTYAAHIYTCIYYKSRSQGQVWTGMDDFVINLCTDCKWSYEYMKWLEESNGWVEKSHEK